MDTMYFDDAHHHSFPSLSQIYPWPSYLPQNFTYRFLKPTVPIYHGCGTIIWSWSTFQRPYNTSFVNSFPARVGVFESWPHAGMLTGLCRWLQLLWGSWVQLFLFIFWDAIFSLYYLCWFSSSSVQVNLMNTCPEQLGQQTHHHFPDQDLKCPF